MLQFDREEKQIADALQALDEKLATPDFLTGIHKKMACPCNKKTIRGRKSLRVFVAIISFLAVMGITAAAISLGAFDWLLEKVNPPFGNVVDAVEQTVSSKGIQMTTIAVKSYEDMAVLYVAVEDTEGLGRVREDSEILIASNLDVQSQGSEMIYYDQMEKIAVYQIRLGAPDTFDGKPLSLKINRLCYGDSALNAVRMNLDVAQAIKNGERNGEPYGDPTRAPSEHLTVGHVAEIPGTTAWVSALGINHGYITVQVGKPLVSDSSEYDCHMTPYLIDDAGNRIDTVSFGAGFELDQQMQPIQSMDQSAYGFTENYFAVDADTLAGYTLCFEGSVWSVLAGEWVLDIDFAQDTNVLKVTADISVGATQMENVELTIHPFGMTLVGNGSRDLNYGDPMSVPTYLETKSGKIALESTFAFRPDSEGPFQVIWHASSSIDLDSILAIWIGDNRVELT